MVETLIVAQSLVNEISAGEMRMGKLVNAHA